MSEQTTPTPKPGLKIEEQHKLAKAAIKHVLNAIADDPRKYWLMGEGTESFAQLTAAAAAIWGVPVEKVRKDFSPGREKWDRYCTEREAQDKLLTHCREKGITVPTD
jgi:hypothetical protein